MKTYRITIEVEVNDEETLFGAALANALVDGMTIKSAKEHLRTQDEIDVGACLVQMLDPGGLPGCDIQHTGWDVV